MIAAPGAVCGGLALPFPCCGTWEKPLALSGPQSPILRTRVLLSFSGSLMTVGQRVLLHGKATSPVAMSLHAASLISLVSM